MFEYVRHLARLRSSFFRGLLVLLGLSVSLQICAPAFVSASHGSLPGDYAHSTVNENFVLHVLNGSRDDLECCVLAAQHADRGQILPVTVSTDPDYRPTVSPAVVAFAPISSNLDKLFEPNAVSASAIARVPIYLSTRRLRN